MGFAQPNAPQIGKVDVNGLLDAPEKGSTIAIAPLENRLLLLSDVPGVNVKSTLTPGGERILRVASKPSISGICTSISTRRYSFFCTASRA